MHIFFIDEAGTIFHPDKLANNHFVLAGPIVPEEAWHDIVKGFTDTCKKWDVKGEIKWRFFGQMIGREDAQNTLTHLTLNDRDQLRRALLESLISNESVTIRAVVIHLPTLYKTIKTAEQQHAYAYESLIELFQLHLQDLSENNSSKINGIIVSDHRNQHQDIEQRNLHMEILKNGRMRYPNLIEGLFFSPSHHSIGIQMADLVSGAIFRFYEKQDDRWYTIIKRNFWKPNLIEK